MKAAAALLAVALLSLASCSRTSTASVDNAQDHFILLDTGWKFELVYNTSDTKKPESGSLGISINPTHDIKQFLAAHPAPVNGWLRNFIQIPDSWPVTPIALTVLQSVASEIFLNGKSIAAFGQIDPTGVKTHEYDPLLRPISISVVPGGRYQLDVHFGLAKRTRYTKVFEFPNPLFRAEIKPMLQHSRTSSGQKEPQDINKLVDEYVRLAYHGFRAKEKDFNATLDLDFDPHAGSLNVVSQDIGRVLLNLLNNAFYSVAEKSKTQGAGYVPVIKVHTKKKDNLMEITVTDNGNGIPGKVLDKVFQPFFTTKPTGQGTGLGLSLSYDIIKAHSGQINIRNTPGEGAKFIITLPINA